MLTIIAQPQWISFISCCVDYLFSFILTCIGASESHSLPYLPKKMANAAIHQELEDGEAFLRLIAFPRCTVSMTAQELVGLIHQSLQHSSEPSYPYYYSNKLLPYLIALNRHVPSSQPVSSDNQQIALVGGLIDLFRVVYFSHHKHKLVDVPQLSMIFHNDCLYVHPSSLRTSDINGSIFCKYWGKDMTPLGIHLNGLTNL